MKKKVVGPIYIIVIVVQLKNLVKNTNQKYLIKIVESKLICPKWHFGQVGHGNRKTIWGFLDQNSELKKL
jgi:hypothetical protein